MQRAKGKSHQAAVRALAFKWIRIIYRCWQTRTAYNEVKYLEKSEEEGITAAELRSKQSRVEIKKSLDSNASVGC